MELGKKGLYVVQSLVVSYVVTGLILCVLAFIMYQSDAGVKVANLGVTITYIVASVLGGFIIGRKVGRRKYLWGLLVGLLYFLILFIISIIIHTEGEIISGEQITSLLLCMAGGTLGGMIS